MTGERCCYCGGPADESDHIEPHSKGGRNDWPNRSPICTRCNAAKSAKSLLLFLLEQRDADDIPRDDIRRSLAILRTQFEELTTARTEVREAMRGLIRQGRQGRIPIATLARDAGVTRNAIYDIIKST